MSDMEKTADRKSAAALEWEVYKSSDFAGKLALMRHEVSFRAERTGDGGELLHFVLDGEIERDYRISREGPGLREFVIDVFNISDGMTREFSWTDGEVMQTWILSRRAWTLYFEAPDIEGRYFIRYTVFRNRLLEAYESVYGWGYGQEIHRYYIPKKDYATLVTIEYEDVFELLRLNENGRSFETTDPDTLLLYIDLRIQELGMENGELDDYGLELTHLQGAIRKAVLKEQQKQQEQEEEKE
ncbi:MAG: hypothetical protein J5744_06975 [Oscillospiraceae bacterium]|nr:hypothetical protein [Oscillospiraceae bacterium]